VAEEVAGSQLEMDFVANVLGIHDGGYISLYKRRCMGGFLVQRAMRVVEVAWGMVSNFIQRG
jgi:hypothetical protein